MAFDGSNFQQVKEKRLQLGPRLAFLFHNCGCYEQTVQLPRFSHRHCKSCGVAASFALLVMLYLHSNFYPLRSHLCAQGVWVPSCSMTTVNVEVKNDIDKKVKTLYEGEPAKYGMIMYLLIAQPEHYANLQQVRDVPEALQAYLTHMQLPAAKIKSPDEAESMLMEYKNHWANEIQRWEDASTFTVAFCQTLKTAHASLAPAAAAASGAASAAAAEAFGESMLHVLCSCHSLMKSQTALLTGDFLNCPMHYISSELHDRAAQAGFESAQSFAKVSTVCRYASRASLVLTAGTLSYELYSNIQMYWRGEIDGSACAERLTTSFGSTAAGFGGGVAAVALCAGAGPCGLLLAGLVGGVACSMFTTMAVSSIFQLFTDRDQSLKRAYEILGLEEGASDFEIRKAYLTLCMKTHPDKGGNPQEFVKVNSAYELIRSSILTNS